MKLARLRILSAILITLWMVGTGYAAIPTTEREALIALYNSTDGDNWIDNSGWKEGPLETDGFGAIGTECNWFGIICYGANEGVLQIDLFNNNLVGPIPSGLKNLTQLETLWLGRNQLSGQIPPPLSELSNLRKIELYSNQLIGQIPPELGNLQNLSDLRLYGNNLSGDIPQEFKNLSNLNYLSLSDNQLTGNLSWLSDLPLLGDINLGNNKFSGTIPPELEFLTDLYRINLSGNQLTGNIPPGLGNLPNLKFLDLSFNQLNGSIPPSFGNLSVLIQLNLHDNYLNGEIPPELGNLSVLQQFFLGHNQLMGTIPRELGNLADLAYFDIRSNQLAGEIPFELSNLTGLTYFSLGWNALYTKDPTLKSFLDANQSGWDLTQTIAPDNFEVSGQSDGTISLAWTPIPSTTIAAGYEIYYSISAEGPYTLTATLSKYDSSTLVDNLEPETQYFFRTRSFTNSHTLNKNRVVSEYTPVVFGTTTGTRDVEISPLGHDFGFVKEGTTVSQLITISNIGTADLTIDNITFQAGSSSDITISSLPTLPLTLAAGGSEQVEVSYTPSSLGLVSANLAIWSNDPDEGVVGVPLTGTGINNPPVANAGLDQTVHVGTLVNLDGSGCTDADGDYPLSYAWQVINMPADSMVTLSSADSISPSFTPDLVGDYTLELVVTDSLGLVSTAGDRVVVSTYNSAPVADAGPDQAVTLVNSLVTLDATQSYDDNGDTFEILWSMAGKPVGSAAVLSDPTAVQPQFLADVHGDYVFSLIATDIFGAESAADSVTVSFENVPPVVDAGMNQTGGTGETIYLDGTRSSDANNDPLTYNWSFASAPVGSGAALNDPFSAQPSFTADEPGAYVLSLVVSDGLESAASTVEIMIVANPVTVTDVLEQAVQVTNNLDSGSFKNDKQKNTMTKKISVVIDMIEAAIADVNGGLFTEALNKLENDVLKKTDGCAASGAADKNDWIKTCAGQQEVYPFIMDAVEKLKAL